LVKIAIALYYTKWMFDKKIGKLFDSEKLDITGYCTDAFGVAMPNLIIEYG
jgi:hypothetical protein